MQTYFTHTDTETYTVEIPEFNKYGILKSYTNNIRIKVQMADFF